DRRRVRGRGPGRVPAPRAHRARAGHLHGEAPRDRGGRGIPRRREPGAALRGRAHHPGSALDPRRRRDADRLRRRIESSPTGGTLVEGPVVVSRKGEVRVLRGHPWVFRTDVVRAPGITPGAVVKVEGPRGRPLGFAFYSARSEIRLRMIDRGDSLPESFLRDRIQAAVRWRETVAEGASACRLVHGEGDRLPSLIVDRYGDHLVVQTLSQGTEARKDDLIRILVELLAP